MPVTIKDIAQIAGVSHTTVSRALRGNASIAPETVSRIKKIADDLGYVPNTVARDLKTNQSGVLGVVVRRIADPFFSEVLSGIESVLFDEGLSLFLASTDRDHQKEESVIRMISAQRVAGAIICSTGSSSLNREKLSKFNVPTVFVNSLDEVEIPFSVVNDDFFGSFELTNYLLECGHRAIAYVTNTAAGRESNERIRGFKAALEAHPTAISPPQIIQCRNGRAASGVDAAQQLLSQTERPTAVMCFNDMMAIGLIQTFQNAGYQIPHDISVVGYDNVEITQFTNPPLTTFDQPKFELGRSAARMMVDIFKNKSSYRPDIDGPIVTLRGQLSIRESVKRLDP